MFIIHWYLVHQNKIANIFIIFYHRISELLQRKFHNITSELDKGNSLFYVLLKIKFG